MLYSQHLYSPRLAAFISFDGFWTDAVLGRQRCSRHRLRLYASAEPRSAVVSEATTTARLGRLSHIGVTFDALLLDQFGVLHDGSTPYQGAVECFNHLVSSGKKIVLLSNSSKRSGKTRSKMASMGFNMAQGATEIITSGDVVFQCLSQLQDSSALGAADEFRGFSAERRRCVVFGNGDDDWEYLKDCGCQVADVADAQFILARGLFELHRDAESPPAVLGAPPLHALGRRVAAAAGAAQQADVPQLSEAEGLVYDVLLQCRAAALPMIVANPDFTRPDGNDSPMPGRLAGLYEAMGGDVRRIGKPHGLAYRIAADWLERQHSVHDRSRVLAVGDSLPHDILGANREGYPSVFIAGGVHYCELGLGRQGGSEMPDEERLRAVLDEYDVSATYCLPSFVW
ncbi:unnamed protein product [Vitrella brassicaformis CCMP3155]|uniref:Uncharacterized protein n=1 Tax=Vitrella brassicaformis (strain CCMP3155) TaxID=1169540 RepID=A0A0G4EGR2_VITBC|nr:unnamed protein product [Vitrella brassicaformis CCMP3155]|eukprot:CEL95437.1 unnamed protein product [Vitrella brassicaformis CCMP3155]